MNDQAPTTDAPAADDKVGQEIAYLKDLQSKPFIGRLAGYVKLSGPGWLQSALTLGGGSLASSLYLGVLCGTTLLWLQPLAMILGIIMLSAISYVTLSTGRRPFRDLNHFITPLLGWTWLLASLMANIVWSMPQYSLATGVIQQNLLPGTFGDGGSLAGTPGMVLISLSILAFSILITWSYGNGNWGVRLYEFLLKIIVALIVLCFVIVVFKLMFGPNPFDWSGFFGGFIPSFDAVFKPSPGFSAFLENIDAGRQDVWADYISAKQRDVLMSAFATAVGINMTFLLPYSMISRGWRKEHRGLSIFDLSTGMFIPFLLATTCVVVASANQFYAVPQPGLVEAAKAGELDATSGQRQEFDKILATIAGKSVTDGKDVDAVIEEMSKDERLLAAALVNRDVRSLSVSLQPLFSNKKIADWIFGLGVLGMAISSITLLMLITGFVVCEIMDVPAVGWPFRIGCLLAAVGVLGPFFWGDAKAYLAIPTSVFGLVLLPLAYLAFFLVMNSKNLLGDAMPTGTTRIWVNIVMGIATGVALFGSYWAINSKLGFYGVVGWLVLFGLIIVGYLMNPNRKENVADPDKM